MFLQEKLFRGHLDEGEKLFFAAHKHWIEIFGSIVQFLMLGIFLPWIIWLFLDVPVFIILIWNVVFWGWFLYNLVDWYFDALLITNMSVIDVEWHSLFHRTSSRVDYQDLKEIEYEIDGFWGTVLSYGTIHIHLNSGSMVDLDHVNNPKKVELEIKGYKDKFMNDQKMTDTTVLQEILADLVKKHIEEHGLPELKKMGRKSF